MSIVSAARQFALKAHEGQLYGDKPYSEHLESVWKIAVSYGLPEHVRAACYLHDVLEDTKITFEELSTEFGFKIADIVFCVTDEPGANRKERKAKTYPKIEASPDAILVKVCDRIANVRESKLNNPGLFKMYQKEHSEFTGHLFNGVMTDLWAAYFKLFE